MQIFKANTYIYLAMNFKCTSYTVLIFWIIFLGNASSSSATGPATQSFDCDGTKIIEHKPDTFSLRENYSLAYKINFNKIITAATCSNEVTNASLKFIYTDGTNKNGVHSTLVASKEAAGKWNCKVWMGTCFMQYHFQLKVTHFHIKTSIEDTYNSTIQTSWSEAIITAKGDNFWIQFTSDFPIVSASCRDVNGNGQLSLNYIDSSSKKSINSHIRAADKVKGPWNCSFDDELGVRKSVLVKVIWKPSTLPASTTTQSTTSLSTTTENNHIAVTIEDSYDSTIQNKGSQIIITAKGVNFWVRFRSDFDIKSASCRDVNRNGQLLSLNYIDSSKKRLNYFIQAADKGPWNCTFKDDLGVEKFVVVKVIWKPSTLSTPTTTQLSTTLSTTTETTGLSSSTQRGEGAPTALTKSTTEAAEIIDDKENTDTPPWLMVGAVVASLVICAILVIVCIVIYRRKAQIPTTAPQPEAPIRIEQSVYYTIHGDDFTEEYSYAYEYARREPLRTNVTCNALYDTVSAPVA